jgi:hypothetical protein
MDKSGFVSAQRCYYWGRRNIELEQEVNTEEIFNRCKFSKVDYKLIYRWPLLSTTGEPREDQKYLKAVAGNFEQ